MSSFGASANQSTDSGTSSLQRSGLNISVGDTKSIVLALQALQSKIRTLEQDRDYHRDEYDRAMQAHEAFKLSAERQADSERAAHHRREQELLELLRQAQAEKLRLEGAVGGNHDEQLGAFRDELESMIAAEKKVTEQRESKLQAEIARLRQEVKDERARHAALSASMEQLKTERESTYRINQQLRDAMKDVQEQQQQQQRTKRVTSSGRGVRPATRTAAAGQRRQPSRDASSRNHSRSSRSSYRDPTCNSRLRDVHNVSGEVDCCCNPTADTSLIAPVAPYGDLGSRRRTSSAHGISHIMQQQFESTSRGGGGAGGSARSTPRRVSGMARPLIGHSPAPAAAAAPTVKGVRSREAIGQVEKQLHEELEDLKEEYTHTLTRATTESLPRHVVTMALQRITTLIDNKMEQLKLMHAARRELGVPMTLDDSNNNNNHVVVGADKATKRTLLVNELRSMLAESADKQ